MLSVDDDPNAGDGAAPTEAAAELSEEITNLSVAEKRGHITGPAGHTYVAHCHHYNCFLQKTLLSKPDLEMEEVLVDTAAMLFFLTFASTFQENRDWSLERRLQFAETFLRRRGYGNPAVTDALDGDTITATDSHHSHGYKVKFGEQDQPQDFFLTGAIQGALMASYGCDVDVRQRQCLSMGDDRNTWTVKRRRGENDRVRKYLNDARRLRDGREEIDVAPAPDQLPAPPVTSVVRNMELVGDDEEGIIAAFNVYLTFIPSLYYNICSQVFIDRLKDSSIGTEMGKRLLKEAGQVCGFFTLGNIVLSSEYELLRKSHFGAGADEHDSMTALFGVVNAFGWGYWTLDYLAEQELRFTVTNSYEAYNHREYFGVSDRPVCYLHTGGGEAIMNALRYGDILNFSGPIGRDYVNGVFEESDGFEAEENHCFATDGPGHACTIRVGQ